MSNGFACGAKRRIIGPLREKGAAGFSSLKQFRGKSRMEPPRSAALFICASSYGGSVGGPRGPAGFREVARSANPSSRRPCLAAGSSVVANRNLRRPFMATSRTKGAPAPTAAASAALPPVLLSRELTRNNLEELDNCARILEGLLELITPYTSEEGSRATLHRESVAWALAPVTEALRAAVDQGWKAWKQGGTQ